MKKRNRVIAFLLVGVMLLSLLPVNALAVESSYNGGLCEHHPEHTAACGYVAEEAGTPCSHAHTEDCYQWTENCTHQHTEACYASGDNIMLIAENQEELEGTAADNSAAVPSEPTACSHVCSAESGCLVKEWNCPHESGQHSEDCGYTERVEEQPCTYVCAICSGTAVEWPEAPGEPGQPTGLKDGQVLDETYGQPVSPVTAEDLAKLQVLSLEAPVAENPDLEIDVEKQLDGPFTVIYVNGEAYTGDDLTVLEGDNFSYTVAWSPHLGDVMTWEEGSWFKTTLFQVPGLNLAAASKIPLSIGGVKVGEYTLNYDKQTGIMTYKVVFNRYIQFFTPDSVMAYVQGSGKFIEENTSGTISVGNKTGTLTINPRPEIPEVTPPASGVGWQPPEAPKFDDTVYPFGKGVKWTNGDDQNAQAHQIEWRVVFLEQLQKAQLEFLENLDWKPTESEGYVIIKDTLDVNQRFYNPPEDASKYGEAPFYIELPVVVPGTGTILNATAGVGNSDYDGPGEIHSLFTGDHFTKIDGERAATSDEIKEVQQQVKETPLSYTITLDPTTRQQTLMINAGKLGTEDSEQGITWSESNRENWPIQELEKKIRDCDAKITAIQSGQESPIALMNQRAVTLLNLLNRAAEIPENQANKEILKQKVQEWEKDYRDWYVDLGVNYLSPLKDANGNPVALPKIELLTTEIQECLVNSKGRKISDTEEYQNYLKSRENIVADQETYLANRLQYGKDWENAKAYYQKALEFYRHDGVYGFAVKVRTESVNTSMTTYSNDVMIALNNKKWSANDNASVTFAGGIIGSYNLGDVVLQKADSFYQTEQDDETDIQQVEQDKAGLAGAQFQMYCGDTTDTPPSLTADNLAHFLDKDASMNGKTYRYTHTGSAHVGGIHGDIDTLITDGEGKLALSAVVPAHNHWLVETKAPTGYYLDATPIKVHTDSNKVSYQLAPNVSRAVLLEKIDSFSKNPVEGAEFTLYKLEGQTETEVQGFSSKALNGHVTYWQDGKGTETLTTNAEGRLCIHGLADGTYILRETKPAPGYLTPNPMPEYRFTLEEKLPTRTADYDEQYHYLLTKPDAPLTNEPNVARLDMTKTGISNALLEGAGFALFRFTGTEAEWQNDPDNEKKWEAVTFNTEQKYFKTANDTKTITVSDENLPTEQTKWKEFQAVLTDSNGVFSITDIPVGHYSVSEVEAPSDQYQRDYRSFYFTVNGDTVGSSVQLYTEPEEKNALTNNTLKNYQKKAKLALVKYDTAQTPPSINGDPLGKPEDGWHYTENVLQDGSAKGLPGATFKLFMRRGASTGKQTNPDPAQLETTEILPYKPGYDTCVAAGTTDQDGVLKLSDMRGRNNNKIEGLNPEEYYMIEVEAPDGYIVDQTPIQFSLNEKIFETNSNTPGLVMMADNAKTNYGLRLTKVDADTVTETNPLLNWFRQADKDKADDDKLPVGLAGAEFQVRQGDRQLYFTGSDGVYQLVLEGTQGATDTIVTGKDGKLILTDLAKDTAYTLTETKPPRGYALPKNPKDREVTITTASSEQDGVLEQGVLFPKTEVQVKNERLLGKVTLHKQAAETGEALKDAEFTLYETVVTVIPPSDSAYDPSKPGATRSEDFVRAVQKTDEEGNLTFDNLSWSNHYYIVETKAPEGYLLDQTKRMFSIDENAFTADGQVIPIQYPAVVNTKGTLGQAKLIKADADNPDLRLPDAHFYLEKNMGKDAGGKEIWVGYGQGMYITDKNGEIPFLLPPGNYKLSEMKAPDGYVIEGMKEIFFTIEEGKDSVPPEPIIIDEKDSTDGLITNRKGDTGVHLQKTIAGTDIPIPGITFRIYWEHLTTDGVKFEDVYFIPQGGGNYEYTDNPKAPGATTDLVTNSDGEIYAMLPISFKDGSPNYPGALSTLMYQETAAPAEIARPLKSGAVGILTEDIYTDISVGNQLTDEFRQKFSIRVQKTDGKSKLGLAGAEFELFTILDLGGDEKFEVEVATGTTDQQGYLTFDKRKDGSPLQVGEPYYIRETKAPTGYMLDATVHEVTIDKNCFDENFQFIPITLSLPNYQVCGSVHLTKVAAEDNTKGLPGAEFELLHKAEADGTWEHYGLERYITDENGELTIADLPYGTYKLIEQAPPLGYLLNDPAFEAEFKIETNGAVIELGNVTNQIDPNPVRDVMVKKVAAEDNNKALAGAEFTLYELKEDGSYRLRQQQPYVTDSNGEFVIENLPLGNYALKELKAPAGYALPEQDMTYFTVKVEERVVELQIENAKLHQGGGGGGGGNDSSFTTSLTVQKIWEDNNSSARPDSVAVQLYRDGEAYGDPVALNMQNGWQYTWELLDCNYIWAVDEVEQIAGYEKSITRKGNVWTITNRSELGNATDSNDPLVPGKPTDPHDPSVQTELDNPDVPLDSGRQPNTNDPSVQPNTQHDGQTTAESEKLAEGAPKTGDNAPLLGWLALICLSAIGLFFLWNKNSVQGKHTKRH